MTNKTTLTAASVFDFLAAIDHPQKRVDSIALNDIFQEITGFTPAMWGDSIIGYGQYHYTYKSGRQGDFLATGFAPRKANISIYIMPGYANFDHILKGLGKFKTGRACLYINKLADIDIKILGNLIRAGLSDLDNHWKVTPT